MLSSRSDGKSLTAAGALNSGGRSGEVHASTVREAKLKAQEAFGGFLRRSVS